MKFKYLIVFSIFILILSLSAVSAADNITNEISQSHESHTLENTVSGDTFADIQNAVDSADDNDVIYIKGTYTGSGSEINVNKNLKFQASSNTTLDAKKLSGVFKSTKDYTITVSNIRFINANGVFLDNFANNMGGCTLIVDNCSFDNCANGRYCVISAAHVTVSNSSFTNNIGSSAAITAYDVKVSDCFFRFNKAPGSGGAISCHDCSVEKSVFIQNYANEGGAIYTKGRLTIINSDLIANYATNKGGAISSNYVDIRNSRLNSNNAGILGGAAVISSGVISNSNIFENYADLSGALYSRSKVTLNECRIVSNKNAAIIAKGISITYNCYHKTYSSKVVLNNDYKSVKLIKVTVTKKVISYKSGKKLRVKLINAYTKKPVKHVGLKLVMKRTKKPHTSKKYYQYTNSKGIAQFKISNLPVGKYTVKIVEGYKHNKNIDYLNCVPTTKVHVTISKAKTVAKIHKTSARHFKVKVKYKSNKKPVKKLKLKVKLWGKKTKTYTIKTNKKGIAKFHSGISKGVYNVKITSKNKSYKVKVVSRIRIG